MRRKTSISSESRTSSSILWKRNKSVTSESHLSPSDHRFSLRKNSTEKSVWSVAESCPIDNGNDFLKELRKLWKAGYLCDITLSVGKTNFSVHKLVLAGYSGYIRDMLISHENSSQNLHIIPLPGIKRDIIKDILEAMYSCNLSISIATVADILSTASFLRIPSVVAACSKFLSRNLSENNCFKTLQIANLYNLKFLLQEASILACTNFSRICEQSDFLQLRYFELQSLLPRHDLSVPSERIIFDAIIRWIEAEKSFRLNYASRLMRNVRFPFLSENELRKIVDSCSYVTEYREIGELIQEAISYHNLPYKRPVLQSCRTRPRTTTKIKSLIGCGGLSMKRDGGLTNKIYCCNVNDGHWKELSSMPEARHHHAAVLLGGFIYIAGGDDGDTWSSPSDKVWRYDLYNNEWLEMPSMNIARESFQMAELDEKLYAVGGRTEGGATTSSVESYDPVSNEWEKKASISSARRHIAIATLLGRLYAVGGSNQDLVSRRVERYNPIKNKWERRQLIHYPRYSASLHAVGSCLWLVGGAIAVAQRSTAGVKGAFEIEVYSPSEDQWTILNRTLSFQNRLSLPSNVAHDHVSSLPKLTRNSEGSEKVRLSIARTEAGSCIYNGIIFLIGGYSWVDNNRIANVECINTNLINDSAQKSEIKKNIAKRHPSLSRYPKCSEHLFPEAPRFNHFLTIQEYPLRCTGVACVSATLYKQPEETKAKK